MIILLMSPEEEHEMDREILKEPVLIYTSPDILTRLFKETYDGIIVTRRFANMAGESNTVHAIKSLNLILPVGDLNVTYLNHHSTEDNVSKQLYKIGCKILRTDIKNMKLKEFQLLKHTENKPIKGISDEEITRDLLGFIKDIEKMDRDSIQLYMNVNYDKITTALLNIKEIIENIDGIRDDNKGLSLELRNALSSERNTHEELVRIRFLYNDMKSKYNKLLQFMTAYKESIDDYNSILTSSAMNSEYTLETNNTDTLVLYFKEIEDINFLRTYNSVVNYLTNVMKLNTKSIILENTNRTYYNPYKGYKVLNTLSTTSEAVLEDRIVRYGNASSILELLLRRQFMVQVLVIFDRTGNDSLVLDSSNQFVYYLGKRRESYPMLEIYDENFISPVEGMWKNIDILLSGSDDLGQIPFDIHAYRHPFLLNLVDLIKVKLGIYE